jgi:hypothetical protein
VGEGGGSGGGVVGRGSTCSAGSDLGPEVEEQQLVALGRLGAAMG